MVRAPDTAVVANFSPTLANPYIDEFGNSTVYGHRKKNNLKDKMASKPVCNLFSQIAVAILLMVVLVIEGCGRKGIPKVASDTKDFEAASPEIKADWGRAMSAVAAHDYATAILTCRKLQMQKELTPEQRTAVIDTITAENNQLLDGLKVGDQNAIQANEEVRKGWRHPQ
jgi:hypothetical protein